MSFPKKKAELKKLSKEVGIFHLMRHIAYVSPQTPLANPPPIPLIRSHILLLPHMETGST